MSKPQAPSSKKIQIQVVAWEKATRLTQEEAEARLHQEGYDTFCWFDVPGTSYPRHRHDCDECLWILSGEIHFNIEGTEYVLRSGDRLYLPALTPHTARVPADVGVTYLVGQKTKDW